MKAKTSPLTVHYNRPPAFLTLAHRHLEKVNNLMPATDPTTTFSVPVDFLRMVAPEAAQGVVEIIFTYRS